MQNYGARLTITDGILHRIWKIFWFFITMYYILLVDHRLFSKLLADIKAYRKRKLVETDIMV